MKSVFIVGFRMGHGFKKLIALSAVGLLLTACASKGANDSGISDPIEGVNRGILYRGAETGGRRLPRRCP